ncbi:LacI family DNA-binding transcriptional regulator [Cellulomonas composti]|uniref:LacI family transcriptional regulator n=1 Tax=Cellulomonas composti TaxID=266130 RepID=A0A511JCP0_9CELL|nr:LacI family DNA-binding transcriptional regulator [Cellulomonas composti]GEL95755.1 LacI family transcriptional regulator [Cellulomonas composti]
MTASDDAVAPATIEEVARRAGVSRSTVSRVLNDVPTVDAAMRRRVEAAVRETGYVPSLAARSLVTGRTHSVALIVAEPSSGATGAAFFERVFSDPYFGRVTGGAQAVLRTQGVHLVVLPADADGHDFVLRYLRQGHVDGALVISSSAELELPRALADLSVPTVLSHDPGPDVRLSWVDADQFAGGRLAAEHLARTGRRRCVAVAGPRDLTAARERLAGFTTTATELGLAVTVLAGDFSAAGGAHAAHTIAAEHPDADSVFAANDVVAESVLHVLQDAGRRVPEDVAVVGFDDNASAAATSPALTTVRQPIEDMAAEMARLLLDRIGRPGQQPRGVMFTPQLVVRASA